MFWTTRHLSRHEATVSRLKRVEKTPSGSSSDVFDGHNSRGYIPIDRLCLRRMIDM